MLVSLQNLFHVAQMLMQAGCQKAGKSVFFIMPFLFFIMHFMLCCRAREAMKEMAGTGMAPGVVCYTILLNAYGKQGDLAAAESVLRDMQANGIRPNKYTYSSLMGWHSQEGNLSKVQASSIVLLLSPCLLCSNY